MSKKPTAKQLIAEAKTAGMEVFRAATLNGAHAYRIADAQKHGMASDPFGRSAALLTIDDVARRLGYPV